MVTSVLPGRFGRIIYIVLLLLFANASCRGEVPTEEIEQPSSLVALLTRTPTQPAIATPWLLPSPIHTLLPTAVPATQTPTVVNTATPTVMPTVPPTATATETPTLTATPVLSATTELDVVTLRLLARRTSRVLNASHGGMLGQIKQIQAEIRSMVFLVNASGLSGTIECPMFHQSYTDLLESGLHFNAPPEFYLPNFYYNRAIERSIIELNIVEEACQSDERWRLGKLPTAELDQTAYAQLFVDANQIMALINESLAWLVGDVGRTRDLYQNVRDQVRQYGLLLEGNLLDNCGELRDIYGEFERAQRLLPPEEFRRAYELYEGAVVEIINTSAELAEQCAPFASEEGANSGGGMPISAETLSTARSGQSVAFYLIEEAIRLLPIPTPVPTQVPVTANLIRVERASTPEYYNVVLRVNLLANVQPREIRVGEFVASPNRVVTIQHTCASDFYDHVEVYTLDGELYTSPKYAIARGNVCDP